MFKGSLFNLAACLLLLASVDSFLHCSKNEIATRLSAKQEEALEVVKPMSWMVPKGVKFGRLDRLQILPEDNSMDDDGDDDHKVIVATKAIGLNFADIFTVLGLYSAANKIRNGQNFVPGLEFSGIVKNDLHPFVKNDRVLGFTRFGAYSDYVKVPPVFLKKLPASWTFEQGASFIVQALTAWHGLVEIGGMPLVHKEKDRTKPYVVVVHSASGGVGLWASEIAARRGATVLGIVGSEEKFKVFNERILDLSPLSRVMLRGNENDFAKRLASELKNIHSVGEEHKDTDLSCLAEAQRGADIVMESLGGKYFKASYKSLNSNGALVTFGSTSYVSPGLGLDFIRLIYRYITRPRIDPGELTSRNLRICGFNLIYLTENTNELERELNECIKCLGSSDYPDLEKVTPPVIGEVFDFKTQAVTAMEKLKSGKTVGKIVLSNVDNN